MCKNEIKTLFVILFILIGMGNILAQDNSSDPANPVNSPNGAQDYCVQLGFAPGCGITGNNLAIDGKKIGFSEDDSALTLNNIEFKNILKEKETGFIEINAKKEVIRAKFTVNIKGGVFTLGKRKFYAPPGSKVLFENNKISVSVIPQTIEVGDAKNIQLYDSETNSAELFYSGGFDDKGKEIEGMKFKINNEIHDLKGVFKIENKNVLLPPEQIKLGALVDGVRIKNKDYSGKNLNLFFDDNFHSGNYLGFGTRKFEAKSDDITILVDFTKESKYAKVDSGDLNGFILNPKSTYSIEMDSEKAFYPKVSFSGETKIVNDMKYFQVDGKNVLLRRVAYFSSGIDPLEEVKKGFTEKFSEEGRKFYSSSESQIFAYGENEEPLLGNFNNFYGDKSIPDHKIVMDNANRIAIIPSYAEDAMAISDDVETLFSTRISYNVPSAGIFESVSGLDVKFGDGRANFAPPGVRDMLVTRLSDYIDYLTPEMLGTVKGFSFYPLSGDVAGSVSGANTKYPVFSSSYFDLHTFSHEVAHSFNFNIESERMSALSDRPEVLEEIRGIEDSVNGLMYERQDLSSILASLNPKSSDAKEVQNEIDSLGKRINAFNQAAENLKKTVPNDFLDSWDKITPNEDYAGKIIRDWPGDDKLTPAQKAELEKEFGDEWKARPKNGFMSQYGSSNKMEDIAEFISLSIARPDLVAKVIDTNNKYYDRRYMEKLDLVYKHGAITREQYNKILDLAGVTTD